MDELFIVQCFVETGSYINLAAFAFVYVINKTRAIVVVLAELQALQGRVVGTEIVPVNSRGGCQWVVADDLLEVRFVDRTVGYHWNVF